LIAAAPSTKQKQKNARDRRERGISASSRSSPLSTCYSRPLLISRMASSFLRFESPTTATTRPRRCTVRHCSPAIPTTANGTRYPGNLVVVRATPFRVIKICPRKKKLSFIGRATSLCRRVVLAVSVIVCVFEGRKLQIKTAAFRGLSSFGKS